jgi:hypothetical protein
MAPVDPRLLQGCPQISEHGERATQEPLVHRVRRDDRVQEKPQALAVDSAAEQLDVGGLASQHMHEVKPFAVAVLEVLQLLQEHDRLGRLVGEQQGDP